MKQFSLSKILLSSLLLTSVSHSLAYADLLCQKDGVLKFVAGDKCPRKFQAVDVSKLAKVTTQVAVVGATGATGPKGDSGVQGLKGDKGDRGEVGAQGLQGEHGLQGVQGDNGDKGDKGEIGIQGLTGIQGVKGDKGDRGDIGATGARGLTGFQGSPGFQGPKGDKGDQGEPGIDKFFTPDQFLNHNFVRKVIQIGPSIGAGLIVPRILDIDCNSRMFITRIQCSKSGQNDVVKIYRGASEYFSSSTVNFPAGYYYQVKTSNNSSSSLIASLNYETYNPTTNMSSLHESLATPIYVELTATYCRIPNSPFVSPFTWYQTLLTDGATCELEIVQPVA